MGTPFTISAQLALPPTPGLPADPIPASMAAVFDSEADFVLNLSSSSGTQSVPLGTMPSVGPKAFLIVYDPQVGGQPIQVKINGSSTGQVELTPGGFLCCANPTPTVGVTQLDIVHTAAGVVRVWVLG